MYCLETTQLIHHFAEKEPVIDNVQMQVPQGSIYGFLGPNGAGKTTTLRLVLGLLKKQQGEIKIFGQSFAKNRIDILRKVGSLIESPSLYGHLTALENLQLLQKVYQCPQNNIPKVLNLVGLANTGKKKTSQFSLGMKQRLSIAIALLHDPTLLILDEPTNGLDPSGIIEMRELLKKLNEEKGITIIISSHLLSEIEKLVTHIGIISKGKMMFQGTLDELKSKQQQSLSVEFDTSDQAKTQAILEANQIPVFEREGKLITASMPKEKIADLNQQLVQNGIAVFEIHVVKNDLEAIFIDLVKN
jgi:lantibiotic transport system ATP-binding protein